MKTRSILNVISLLIILCLSCKTIPQWLSINGKKLSPQLVNCLRTNAKEYQTEEDSTVEEVINSLSLWEFVIVDPKISDLKISLSIESQDEGTFLLELCRKIDAEIIVGPCSELLFIGQQKEATRAKSIAELLNRIDDKSFDLIIGKGLCSDGRTSLSSFLNNINRRRIAFKTTDIRIIDKTNHSKEVAPFAQIADRNTPFKSVLWLFLLLSDVHVTMDGNDLIID